MNGTDDIGGGGRPSPLGGMSVEVTGSHDAIRPDEPPADHQGWRTGAPADPIDVGGIDVGGVDVGGIDVGRIDVGGPDTFTAPPPAAAPSWLAHWPGPAAPPPVPPPSESGGDTWPSIRPGAGAGAAEPFAPQPPRPNRMIDGVPTRTFDPLLDHGLPPAGGAATGEYRPSTQYPAPPPPPFPPVAPPMPPMPPMPATGPYRSGRVASWLRDPPFDDPPFDEPPFDEPRFDEPPAEDPLADAAPADDYGWEPEQRYSDPSGLSTGALLPAVPDTASRGWRRLVYQVSAGAVNPGPSPDEARYRRLLNRIRTPLDDCHRIAVLSLKGGVGKTTTTVSLGSTLASLRGDRVVAIDANPDRGTLGARVESTTRHTVRDLLLDAHQLHRYVDVRRYLSQSDSRLEVLASASDPEISDAFTDEDYRAVDDLLQRHYSILLTDCGTGMVHSAMRGVLDLADTLVIVSSASADGGASASGTLDWLDAHGYHPHVSEAVTVMTMFPQHGETVDVDALEDHFAARTRQVVRVPFDPHLAAGGPVVLDELRRETRRAYEEIAGAVAERFQ